MKWVEAATPWRSCNQGQPITEQALPLPRWDGKATWAPQVAPVAPPWTCRWALQCQGRMSGALSCWNRGCLPCRGAADPLSPSLVLQVLGGVGAQTGAPVFPHTTFSGWSSGSLGWPGVGACAGQGLWAEILTGYGPQAHEDSSAGPRVLAAAGGGSRELGNERVLGVAAGLGTASLEGTCL